MSVKSGDNRQQTHVPAFIRYTTKVLGFFSPRLLTLFAARLFTTPIKHKIPKREFEMDSLSVRQFLYVESIKKKIVVYQYGKGEKKILLVHGWSGRGTQLVKIADVLVANGFAVISFDAPAHGRSSGSTTLMPEFVAAILTIQQIYGPFEAAIGHSLGGMSALHAASKGLNIQRLVTIGSGDIVKDIMDDFVRKLGIKPKYSNMLRDHFERKSNETMESFSAYMSAHALEIPVLVVHDRDDHEVPVTAAVHIHKHLKFGQLVLTSGLGHRKILGDKATIKKVIRFIKDSDEKDDNDDGGVGYDYSMPGATKGQHKRDA